MSIHTPQSLYPGPRPSQLQIIRPLSDFNQPNYPLLHSATDHNLLASPLSRAPMYLNVPTSGYPLLTPGSNINYNFSSHSQSPRYQSSLFQVASKNILPAYFLPNVNNNSLSPSIINRDNLIEQSSKYNKMSLNNEGNIANVRIPRGSAMDSYRNSPLVYSGQKGHSSLPPVQNVETIESISSGKKQMKFILPAQPPESLLKQLGRTKKSLSYFKNTNQSQGSIMLNKDEYYTSEDQKLQDNGTYRYDDEIKEHEKGENHYYYQRNFLAGKNKIPFIVPREHRKSSHFIESLGASGVYRSQSLAKEENIGKLIEMPKRTITREKNQKASSRKVKAKDSSDDVTPKQKPRESRPEMRGRIIKKRDEIRKEGLLQEGDLSAILAKKDGKRNKGQDIEEITLEKERYYKDKKLMDILADLDALDTEPSEDIRGKKGRKKRVFH